MNKTRHRLITSMPFVFYCKAPWKCFRCSKNHTCKSLPSSFKKSRLLETCLLLSLSLVGFGSILTHFRPTVPTKLGRFRPSVHRRRFNYIQNSDFCTQNTSFKREKSPLLTILHEPIGLEPRCSKLLTVSR